MTKGHLGTIKRRRRGRKTLLNVSFRSTERQTPSTAGAVFSLIGCVMLYGAVGAAGYLQGKWHNDEVDMSDLHKIRAFSPFVKQLITNGMAKNNGLLTYTLLESLLCEIEFALKEDDLRFNINKQLNV
ncbi:hypothetical protein [Enterobacter sp. CPE_E222]|uniref:hypothetical protein n=1 Tax=Enterobacter sp. CPE_E222 TaxID=3383890 RepID=UPI0039754CB2